MDTPIAVYAATKDKILRIFGITEKDDESDSDYWDSSEEEEDDLTMTAFDLDSNQLSKFLYDISVEHEGQELRQLVMFMDHMGSLLFEVSRFPWLKTVDHGRFIARVIVQIPLAKVPDDVRKVSTDWLNQLPVEDIEDILLRTLEYICRDLLCIRAWFNSEQVFRHYESSKSRVGSFFILQMVLQCKPDVLISVWPQLEKRLSILHCWEEDRNIVLAWVISQARQGNRFVAEFLWVKYLCPLLTSDQANLVIESLGGFTCVYNDKVNQVALPRSLDEKLAISGFLANSTEYRKLVNGYRMEKYKTLLASPGSEAAMRISNHLIPFAIKASGEDNSDLAKEGRHIFFWCLKNNLDSFKQWDDMYLENLDGSVFILKKLSIKWRKMLLKNRSILSPLMKTMKSFISKNEKALAGECDASRRATLEKALKYAKTNLGPSLITLDW